MSNSNDWAARIKRLQEPVQPAQAPQEKPMSDAQTIRIDLVAGGNAAAYLGKGWGTPEPHGTWTTDRESRLAISGLAADRDHRLTIVLGPYLCPPAVTFQDVTIVANGFDLTTSRLERGGEISVTIPAAIIAMKPTLDLALRCPHAISPAALGASDDVRWLGVSVWRITLAPQAAAAPDAVPAAVPLKPAPKVCAVTMVYNEAEYLPIWLKHHAAQVGRENCFIIDHGSDDGSTAGLSGCNVIRIPRSPYDPDRQSKFNSEFCSSLLNWYDWVVYSDVDEMIMADPRIAPNLIEYCRRPLPDKVTAIGLNIAHRLDQEGPLDFSLPVTAQRRYVFTASSMCKPILIQKPVTWSPGSHSCETPIAFDHLYLFHLRWADLPYGLRRLHKTRNMAWNEAFARNHQRVEDDKMIATFQGFARLPPVDDVDLAPSDPHVRRFLAAVEKSQAGRERDTFKIDLSIWADNMWRLPERFVGVF